MWWSVDLKWDSGADCEKGAARIRGILACNTRPCSNRGTCSPTDSTDDGYLCTCNPDLGGGWAGKNCELCNGEEPVPDSPKECSGITPNNCNTIPNLPRACPQTCGGMCF
eukprot:gene8788-32284_t